MKRLIALSLAIGFAAVSPVRLLGQQDTATVARSVNQQHQWIISSSDGEPEYVLDETRPRDSLDVVVRDLFVGLEKEGYLDVVVDSLTTRGDSVSVVHLTKGIPYRIRSIEIRGANDFTSSDILLRFNTQTGGTLDIGILEADILNLLSEYDRSGMLTAEVAVRDIQLFAEDNRGFIDIVIDIDEGERPALAEVRPVGALRTRSIYIARMAGVKEGEVVQSFDADELQRRLTATGLFKSVFTPTMEISEDGTAVLLVPLEEGPPGNFDAILGYLPSSSGSGKGSIIGNVDIALRHMLGEGRSFAFKFNRLPARVTRIALSGEDPRIAGWPVRLAASFDGYQRDSTFTRRQWQVEAGYEIARGIELFATLSLEGTRPGVDSLINVPRSNSWFAGVGFSAMRLDNPVNPRSGWNLRVNLEQGRKSRTMGKPGQSVSQSFIEEAFGQQRLRVDGSLFLPVGRRQTVLFAAQSSLLESSEYDESDMFRIGGANSLRGYNEEQFLGNVVGRGLVEWRYLLDPTSYIFVFFDIGMVGRPDEADTLPTLEGAHEAEKKWDTLPGYGFGLRFGTTAGLFSVSLALNPDEGLGTKVHVGVSLGL